MKQDPTDLRKGVEDLYRKLLLLADHTRKADRNGTTLETIYLLVAHDLAEVLGRHLPKKREERILTLFRTIYRREPADNVVPTKVGKSRQRKTYKT